MKRFLRSRKFWIMVMVFFLIWSGFYMAVGMKGVTEDSTALMFSIAVGATVVFGMAGIGGYVWKDWIVSKHYRQELSGK